MFTGTKLLVNWHKYILTPNGHWITDYGLARLCNRPCNAVVMLLQNMVIILAFVVVYIVLYILITIALPVDTLLEPLEIVLDSRQTDKHLRVSALSIIGVACQTCPVALMDKLWYLMNWILTILEVEKAVEIRRGTVRYVYNCKVMWT